MNFGGSIFTGAVASLKPQEDWGPNGLEPNEPWTDDEVFAEWLVTTGFSEEEIKLLTKNVPKIDLALNHGPLFGVRNFIDMNSEAKTSIAFSFFSREPNVLKTCPWRLWNTF